jgi:hypothetical protein
VGGFQNVSYISYILVNFSQLATPRTPAGFLGQIRNPDKNWVPKFG